MKQNVLILSQIIQKVIENTFMSELLEFDITVFVHFSVKYKINLIVLDDKYFYYFLFTFKKKLV